MRPTILIVDDEFGLAEMISEVLTDRGYEARVAINGQDALWRMHEAPVDLVLMDTMMPIMDGPTALARIRTDHRLMHIPVVMMSAAEHARPPDGTAYHAFLVKPFSMCLLLSTIEPLLDGTTAHTTH